MNIKIYDDNENGIVIAVCERENGGKYAIELSNVDIDVLECEGETIHDHIHRGFEGWDTIENTDGEDVQRDVIEQVERESNLVYCEKQAPNGIISRMNIGKMGQQSLKLFGFDKEEE